MKNQKTPLLVVIFFIILLITLIASLTCLAVIQEVKTLGIQLKVADNMGFNTDTDRLYFGTIPRGNSGGREIIIENINYKNTRVRLKISGELKDWVTASENNFNLKEGESKRVKLEVKVPQNAELRDYKSKLLILFTRV